MTQTCAAGTSDVAGDVLRDAIFVVGCPRSGTTLLQCMLSAHSQAYSLPETHFFSIVLPRLGVRAHEHLSDAQVAEARAILESEARLFLPAKPTDGRVMALDLFRALVAAHRPADAFPGARVIEKTPQHVLALAEIRALLPSARCVNIVRHPLDVVSSWLQTPFAQSRGVLGYAAAWNDCVEAAEAYAAAEPERLVTVVYERLVRDPEAELKRVADFLRLSYEPAMVDAFGAEAARAVGSNETWKVGVRQGVLVSGEGAWRGRISAGQAWLVAQATAGKRERYGYVEAPQASAAEVAAALLQEGKTRYHENARHVGRIGAARHAMAAARVLVR